jgi:hypothetical protein
MSIIIGGMTQVSAQFVTQSAITDGFQSINWNVNMQPNRLWVLGSWDPYKTQVGKTISVSLTTYAGVFSPVTLSPSTTCENSNARAHIIINADTCGVSAAVNVDISNMYLTSYSYSKGDVTGFGTESWSFQTWLASNVTGSEFIEVPDPSYVLQGRAEGSYSGNVGTGSEDMGVVMEVDGQVTGSQGSVSAGFPGVGNANDTILGLITRVGGGLLEADGQTGQSSATIPHQPLYIG